MKRKASHKRDAVLEILRNTTTHPTADWIYERILEEYPGAGISTVYRNLKILLEQKMIMKIDVGDGLDHYDANIHIEHAHTYCIKCGAIGDIKPITGEILQHFAEEDFLAETYSLVLTGKCKNCTQEESLGK